MLHTVPSFWRRAVSGGGAREREVSLSLSGSLRPSLLWERTISLVSFSSIKVRRVPSSGRYRTPSRGTSLPAPRGLLPYSGHLVEEKKKVMERENMKVRVRGRVRAGEELPCLCGRLCVGERAGQQCLQVTESVSSASRQGLSSRASAGAPEPCEGCSLERRMEAVRRAQGACVRRVPAGLCQAEMGLQRASPCAKTQPHTTRSRLSLPPSPAGPCQRAEPRPWESRAEARRTEGGFA